MLETTWFMFVMWLILFIVSMNRNEALLKVVSVFFGFFLGLSLIGDSETIINYVGMLLFIMNLGYLLMIAKGK